MRPYVRLCVLLFACACLTLASAVSAQEPRFPSFAPEHAPPPGYDGMVFSLSQDYPTEAPPAETLPWDSIDFFTEPLAYARAVLAYGVEGNEEVDWVVQNNAVRPWYHAPWMHPGCGGREFVRGMTRERSSRPGELHPNQTDWVDNWAVGFYSPPGGYTVGQVWQDAQNPVPSRTTFPHGTVGMKLLFTTATVEQAPFLEGSLEWTANIYPLTGANPCVGTEPPRQNQTLRLLQIDIAIREPRKDDTTGWVFGTFIYDGSAPGDSPFDRMQPVGLMWADDSGVMTDMNRPGVYVNPDLRDGSLNADLIGPWNPDDPTAVRLVHAGLGGRLNGPVDNPISSCMSCHGRAGAPSQPVVPSGIARPEDYTEEAFRQFFADIPHGAGTATGADGNEYTRLDYSLQLAVGIRNFLVSMPQEFVGAELGTGPGPEISRDEGEDERWQDAGTAAAEPAGDVPQPAAGEEGQAIGSYGYYAAIGILLLAIVVFFALRARRA
jgi:hypothetical protein